MEEEEAAVRRGRARLDERGDIFGTNRRVKLMNCDGLYLDIRSGFYDNWMIICFYIYSFD